MNRILHATVAGLAPWVFLAVPAAPAWADGPEGVKVVSGMEFHLGIVPAAVLRSAAAGSEHRMHGGPPQGAGQYHVMVAIFDTASGRRIDDAHVEAHVGALGMASRDKPLERMPLAGTMSYGNYFRMPGRGPYEIVLDVTRPGRRGPPVEVRFEHGSS